MNKKIFIKSPATFYTIRNDNGVEIFKGTKREVSNFVLIEIESRNGDDPECSIFKNGNEEISWSIPNLENWSGRKLGIDLSLLSDFTPEEIDSFLSA